MEIIENTLMCEYETWDDPGDYPSGAGGGPFPSYDFVGSITGYLTIQFSEQDITNARLTFESPTHTDEAIIRLMISEEVGIDLTDTPIECELDCRLRVTSWTVKEIVNRVAILEVEEFDSW